MQTPSSNDRGASAVEYALVLFAVAVVIAATLFAFGRFVAEAFTDSCETIKDATSSSSAC